MIFKKTLINLSNSVFLKSIQSKINERGIRIVMNKKTRNKCASTIHFKENIFLSDHLQLIEKDKRSSAK